MVGSRYPQPYPGARGILVGAGLQQTAHAFGLVVLSREHQSAAAFLFGWGATTILDFSAYANVWETGDRKFEQKCRNRPFELSA
jgi:hypothetical protein